MLTSINLTDILYVHATFDKSGEKDGCDQPGTLRQLSWQQQGLSIHVLVQPPNEAEVASDGNIAVAVDEAAAVSGFWTMVRGQAAAPWFIMAGWRIRNELWPRLITLGIRYKVGIPQLLVGDPMQRFGGPKHLLEVSDIYTQGAYNNVRPIPELSDCLRIMNIPPSSLGTTNPFVTTESLAKLSLADWKRYGCDQVDALLLGMANLVHHYYHMDI
jgi:hypothetical protein